MRKSAELDGAMAGSSAIWFTRAYVSEVRHGGRVNRIISRRIRDEVNRKGMGEDNSSSKRRCATAEDWEMFEKKIVRPRPRLFGAVAAYSLLSGLPHEDIVRNGGSEIFRLLWFLGSSQDDLIDEIPKIEIEGMNKVQRKARIRRAVFGNERTFYQCSYAVIIQTLSQSGIPEEGKVYLKRKFAEWYRFLTEQEADVLGTDLPMMSYKYCKNYREQQNGQIGSVLVACLNGMRCLDPGLQELERDVPLLSFRTQIVDDIADTVEDLSMGRPSYVVGALVDNPNDMARVLEFIRSRPEVAKFTPKLLRTLAPRSFDTVKGDYDGYANELMRHGKRGKFLVGLGDPLFYLFPAYRDLMYRINPNYANF
ncbi:MAG: hypothetical protein KatS3mg087_0409 [Patescibacteria group bacterium]|nr:MAG: hypothetical protein KatS3mg087_0409 [Patescibacteria group bacterium]